ncbi:MAG: hypothetical protein ACXWJW_04720, partial [Xanthobacteraceae bacterium]
DEAGRTSAPDHTVPPPPQSQPQAPIADQAAPAAVGPAQANTAGASDDAVPLGATGQTMPSTISSKNAALDKLPTTALQFPMSDDEKKLIAKAVTSSADAPVSLSLHVADFLPLGMAYRDLPVDVTKQFPLARRYRYAKLDGSLVIVDPINRVVVGEIAQ